MSGMTGGGNATSASPVIFNSWQSDLPRHSTRDVIDSAAAIAIREIAGGLIIEDAPRLDHSTLGQSGAPAISESIFRKIRNSAIFLADVTFVAETMHHDSSRRKRSPNPNVLIELGYAAAKLGWERVILVMNKKHGSPDRLPFDLKHRRFPITFDLGPESSRRPDVIAVLASELSTAIGLCLSSEYERVNEVLSRLMSTARSMLSEFGNAEYLHEVSAENGPFSRHDHAVSQLIEFGLVTSVPKKTATGFAYPWTYLGRQCIGRFGVRPVGMITQPENVIADLTAYESITKPAPSESIAVRDFEPEKLSRL